MSASPQGFIVPLENVGPVPKSFAFDEKRLVEYLRVHMDVFPKSGHMTVGKFKFGQSNPTYLLTIGQTRYVLRKKPPGKLLKSAHLIEREFQVMDLLRRTPVPVPYCYHLCTDASVIGTPFYICEFVNGRVFQSPQLKAMKSTDRFAIFHELCRVLAAIHSVNIVTGGLQMYTKARKIDSHGRLVYDGYVKRLVKRWTQQYEAARTKETANRCVEELFEALTSYRRQDYTDDRSEPNCLIHGDYRLDNVVFHPTRNKIIAVLDWELSTIGHPLTDLATCCLMYRFKAQSTQYSSMDGVKGLALPEMGIPSELQFIQGYIRNLSLGSALIEKYSFPLTEWNFYLGLSLFRLVGIFQGIWKRIVDGNASNPALTLPVFNQVMTYLAETALSTLRRVDIFEALRYENLSDEAKTRLPSHLEAFRGEFSPPFFKHRANLQYFVEKYVVIAEKQAARYYLEPKHKWKVWPGLEELKRVAQKLGLWNLFLPKEYPEGAGLTNLEYAPLCEIMGRHPHLTPEACNCSAPDTGNMEVLARYGNEEQKKKYLQPLLKGKIRSCFGMTEPDWACSDARNVQSSIRETSDGESYVINGRKWWTSGAMDPRCDICILMGVSNPKAPSYLQQSMIIVPMKAPGVQIVRHLSVYGYDDAPHGHAEVIFDRVRVPKANMILGPGRGFEIAQGRLGPGRIHHCMRLIGMAERALGIFRRRVLTRHTFGKGTHEHTSIRQELSDCRCEIEQSRLLTLQAAGMMDKIGNKKARQHISMIKVVAPRMAVTVIDKAIQAYGGGGVCQDTVLASLWTAARSLRIADGPDAVHQAVVGRIELARAKL